MTTSVRMTSEQHSQLMSHLFPGDGCEAVALLLCGRRESGPRPVLVVRKVVPVPYESCSIRTPDRVQWSTDVLDELIPEIWKSNASVVKVHCHPTGFDRFSAIDDLSDGELALSFEGSSTKAGCTEASSSFRMDASLDGHFRMERSETTLD